MRNCRNNAKMHRSKIPSHAIITDGASHQVKFSLHQFSKCEVKINIVSNTTCTDTLCLYTTHRPRDTINFLVCNFAKYSSILKKSFTVRLGSKLYFVKIPPQFKRVATLF